jgi:hypothetical protein
VSVSQCRSNPPVLQSPRVAKPSPYIVSSTSGSQVTILRRRCDREARWNGHFTTSRVVGRLQNLSIRLIALARLWGYKPNERSPDRPAACFLIAVYVAGLSLRNQDPPLGTISFTGQANSRISRKPRFRQASGQSCAPAVYQMGRAPTRTKEPAHGMSSGWTVKKELRRSGRQADMATHQTLTDARRRTT